VESSARPSTEAHGRGGRTRLAAATRAPEIDPTLAEAETSLATAKFNYDWTGRGTRFPTRHPMDPRYATAYQRYSLYSIAMGRFDESLNK
jgi:hypothetical protein